MYFIQNDRAKLKRHPSLFSRKSKPKVSNGEITQTNGGTELPSNDDIQQS